MTWKDLSSSLLFLALRLFWAKEILCSFERCNKDKAFTKSTMTKRDGGYVLNAESSQCTLILDCLMLFGWIRFHFMGIMGIETPLSEGFKTCSFLFSLLYSEQREPGCSSPLCSWSCKWHCNVSLFLDQGLICLWSVLQPTMCKKVFLLKNVPAHEPGWYISEHLGSSLFQYFCIVSFCLDLELCLALRAARVSLCLGCLSTHSASSRLCMSTTLGA